MQQITDYFIPDEIAARESIERKRARIVIHSFFATLLWAPVAGLMYWYGGSTDAVYALTVGASASVLTPFLLRWTGSLEVAGNYFLVVLAALLVTLSYFFGGLEAPPLSWMLLVPIFAVLYHGIRPGAIWLVVVIGIWSAFAVGEFTGFPFEDQLRDEVLMPLRVVEMVGIGTVVFLVIYLKDGLQEWLVEQMREREAETHAVLETAPDGILTVDDAGHILTANRAASTFLGRPSEDIVGERVQSLIATLERRSWTGQAGEPVSDDDHLARRGDGDDFPVEVAFGTLGASSQKAAVIVFRDITERKESQLELEKARDDALEASRAKSEFLANMSHELRTPLNAVIGYSEMTIEELEFIQSSQQEGAEVVGPLLPDLHRIRTAGQHLLALINDILDLSKIEAGKMGMHVELFDVVELLDDIAGTIRPLADKNDNRLEVEVGEHVHYMRSDKTKVRQILFNLLSNACKFTREGQVTLRARRDDETGEVVFDVRDNGIGMSDDQLEKVFDAFTQADSSTTREFGGTGLGLTITAHFCSLLGGDITVDSEVDVGTTFTARLDADLEGESSSGESTDAAESTTSELREAVDPVGEAEQVVLVIDDDSSMRDLLTRVLTRDGFRVVTAASGSEGLLLADEIQPDVITLDVMMPSMDGWTMLSKLKQRPALADTPVVMVTMVDESSRGYALGADHYLVKPVDREELVDVMGAYRGADGEPGHGRLLIVEDDEPTRSLIRRTLEDDGWSVVTAQNGQLGLERLETSQPDLVVLDLMMPTMDGFEFLTHLRAHDEYRDVPVVVVTAKELTDNERKTLRAGVSEVLSKDGSEREQLLDEVREQVARVARDSESNHHKSTA